MKSIRFPDMFNSNSTKVVKDLDATKQNTLLLLCTEKGELFGDPYFGLRLKRYIYEQNNYILKDVIIDEIYTQLALFMPQITVNRTDIKLIQDKTKLYCSFKATNQLDFTTNMYSLVLYDEETL
jgi:phage baseplate assembly protein W